MINCSGPYNVLVTSDGLHQTPIQWLSHSTKLYWNLEKNTMDFLFCINDCCRHLIVNRCNLVHYLIGTLIVPISVCGINTWNTHYFGESQNLWGLNCLLSDMKFMNTCSFTIHYKKINVCTKVLMEWFKIIYARKCLSIIVPWWIVSTLSE